MAKIFRFTSNNSMANAISAASMTSYTSDLYRSMFAARADQEIRIVLAGKTGEGKSAMGNAILGHSPFVAKRSMKSETSFCQVGERNLDGRRVIVVDTPGLFDTNADPHHVAKEIGKAVMMSSPGPHCFIVTISARNRFTEEAQQTVNLLHDIFGGDVLSYCIVVFTNEDAITDEGMTFDKWLPEQTGQLPGLADLINRCSRRYMAINSKSKSTNELDRKVRQLVSMINGMLAQNNGRVYTNDMYKQAEAAAQAREAEKLCEAAAKDKAFKQQMKKLEDRLKLTKKQVQKAKAKVKASEDCLKAMKAQQRSERETRHREYKSAAKSIKKGRVCDTSSDFSSSDSSSSDSSSSDSSSSDSSSSDSSSSDSSSSDSSTSDSSSSDSSSSD